MSWNSEMQVKCEKPKLPLHFSLEQRGIIFPLKETLCQLKYPNYNWLSFMLADLLDHFWKREKNGIFE